jgi:hypothetical protein
LYRLNIALELAKHNSVYEDMASKFFEHFLFISDAMAFDGGQTGEASLWNDEEGFYFDAITWGPGSSKELPIRSLVGLIPLYATLTLEPSTLKKMPGFKKRMEWFIENRSAMSKRNIANMSRASRLSLFFRRLMTEGCVRSRWKGRQASSRSRERGPSPSYPRSNARRERVPQ